ncbi:hypothetical protein [Aporhodopirellula aestuarii]|nr:hypothetical protein [Aporhodopirellula aestuarii]
MPHDEAHPDWVLLGWLAVWSLVLTFTIGGILNGQTSRGLPDETQLTLGLALGGLCAAWITIGSWVALIHLPRRDDLQTRSDTAKQQMRPRIAVVLAWFANLVLFIALIPQEFDIIAQLLAIVGLGITGPMIAWQWSHRRIHRGEPQTAGRQSIRQILGIAFTIAVAMASLKLYERCLGLSASATTLLVSVAISWLLMLRIMLGRWWAFIFAVLPTGFFFRMVVLSLIDLRSRDSEAQILRSTGILVGFYFFALIFLLLMRSSGHRWFGEPTEPLTNRDNSALSNDDDAAARDEVGASPIL